MTSLIHLRARIELGELSPSAAIEQSLARIEELDPTVGAFVTINREAALAAAARRQGPLMGIAVGVQGHPRHCRYADRNGLVHLCWMATESGCRTCYDGPEGGCQHHRQDGHLYVCTRRPTADPQSGRRAIFAGRLLVRLGGGSRCGYGPACIWDANRRVYYPAGIILWNGGDQALVQSAAHEWPKVACAPRSIRPAYSLPQ